MPATRKHLHVSKPRRRQRSVSLETRASRCGVKNYLNVMRSLHPDEKREYFPVTVDYMQEYIGTKKRQGSIKANSLDQYFQHIESYNLALGHGWDSTVFEPMMREVLEELETEEKKNPENEEKKKKKAPNGGETKRKSKKQQQQQQQEGDQPQGGQQGAPKQGSQSTPQQGVQLQQQSEQQPQGKQSPLQQQVEQRAQQQGAQQGAQQQGTQQQGAQQQGAQQPQSHQPQNAEQQQRQQQKHQRQLLRQRETPVTSDPMQVDGPPPGSGSSIEFKIDVQDDNAADQTAAAPSKPPLTIGTGMDPQNHLEPLTPRKSPPRSALEILTDYTESGTPSPTFQPQHQLRAVTIRSQNKVYRNNVAVTDTTTFGAVLSYAIGKSPPPGKQFVLRSTDGDLEYMPDALVRKVICGPVHADVVVTIEDVRDVDFNHF